MNILLLSIFIVEIIIVITFSYYIRLHLKKARAYSLYAVRDKLIYLVAAGRLKEDDTLFKVFYEAVNIIISNSEYITLKNFIRAMADAEKKGVDPASAEIRKKIIAQLKATNDDEIKTTINLYYCSIFQLLKENSIVLNIAAWIWKFSDKVSLNRRTTQTLRALIPQFTHHQKASWKYFAEYGKAVRACA